MLFAWLFGVFVFAVLVGQVKEIIAQSTRSQDEYMKIFDNISQYMIRMKVSSDRFPYTTNCGICYVGPSGDGPASQDLVPVYVEHSEKFRRARDSPVFTRKNDDRRRPEYTFQNYFRS